MTSSIFHFFEDLYQRRSHLATAKIKPDHFPYRDELLSLSGSRGQFPDLAIKINTEGNLYTGGELIEVKDSTSGYNISSFNSTIPAGIKPIRDVAPLNSKIFREMQEAGDNVYSLQNRDVYYLLRGKKKDSTKKKKENTKICLTHGSFFETISSKSILQTAFEQVIDEAMSEAQPYLSADFESAKKTILSLDWKQSHFSSVRKVDNSAISVRFRVMSEVVKEANLLNSDQYPSITDNTLNFILPLSEVPNDEKIETKSVELTNLLANAFPTGKLPNVFTQFRLSHNLRSNWQYLVFQCPL